MLQLHPLNDTHTLWRLIFRKLDTNSSKYTKCSFCPMYVKGRSCCDRAYKTKSHIRKNHLKRGQTLDATVVYQCTCGFVFVLSSGQSLRDVHDGCEFLPLSTWSMFIWCETCQESVEDEAYETHVMKHAQFPIVLQDPDDDVTKVYEIDGFSFELVLLLHGFKFSFQYRTLKERVAAF